MRSRGRVILGNASELLEMFRTLAREIYERANPTGLQALNLVLSLLSTTIKQFWEANLLT